MVDITDAQKEAAMLVLASALQAPAANALAGHNVYLAVRTVADALGIPIEERGQGA